MFYPFTIMYLLIGLGNPEKSYQGNRHNIGFQLIDRIAETYNFPPLRKKHHGLASQGLIAGEKVVLLKPQTFYNDSGRAGQDAARFYKIPPEHIFVLHDDLDITPGKIKIKKGGGAAGNNGLKSLMAHLDGDFYRLRIGIGHPGDKAKVTNYVLGNFSKNEREDWVDELLDAAARALPLLLSEKEQGPARFLSDLAIRLGKNNRPNPNQKKPGKDRNEISKPKNPTAQEEKTEAKGALGTLLQNLFHQDNGKD